MTTIGGLPGAVSGATGEAVRDRDPRTPLVAVAAWGIVLAIIVVGLLTIVVGAGLVLAGAETQTTPLDIVLMPVTGAAFAVVGGVVIIRGRVGVMGWVLVAVGLALCLSMASVTAMAWVVASSADLRYAAAAEWLGSACWYVMLAILWPRLFLLFPDGRLPSPRWRIVDAVQLLAVGMVTVLILAPSPQAVIRPAWGFDALAEPAAIVERWGYPVVLVLLLAGALALVTRFRRARGVERAQLKWAAWAVLLFAGGSLASAVIGLVSVPVADAIGWLNVVGLLLLPVSIGIAILRYRLYDIDRLISRTIGWGVLSGLLIATFVALVVTLGSVLQSLAGGSTLAIAVSTLVAAALFSPLRARVQRAVDRRFDRARADHDRVLAGFTERMRDEIDLGSIDADLRRTIDVAVRPATVSSWLRDPS